MSKTWENTLNRLESGELRSASLVNGVWTAHAEVKQDILEAFKAGKMTEIGGFVDKHNLPPRTFSVADGGAFSARWHFGTEGGFCRKRGHSHASLLH